MFGLFRAPRDVIRDYYTTEEIELALDEPSATALWFQEQPWVFLVWTAAIALIVVRPAVWWFAILGSLAVGCWVFLKDLQRKFTVYAVTNMRVIQIKGILSRTCEFIPWAKVTDIRYTQSFSDKVLGIATIRLLSATEKSDFGALRDLRHPRQFYELCVHQVAQFSKRDWTPYVEWQLGDRNRVAAYPPIVTRIPELRSELKQRPPMPRLRRSKHDLEQTDGPAGRRPPARRSTPTDDDWQTRAFEEYLDDES